MTEHTKAYRKASKKDTKQLRKLAAISEAHWGYDQMFMDTFDRIFNISEEFIVNNPVYVLLSEQDAEEQEADWKEPIDILSEQKAEEQEANQKKVAGQEANDFLREQKNSIFQVSQDPVAFWGLCRDGDCWELEYFYVAEATLGRGYGKQLWTHLMDWCREHRIPEIQFVTSPQAVGFYERMGAVQDRMVASVIDGRNIPHLTAFIK